MSNNNYISGVINFLVFASLQIIVFNNFILFDTAFTFFYVGFLLFAPFDIDKLWFITLGFIMGISIDIFNDTIGVNAAACVAMTFIRPYWQSINTPRGGYENVNLPNVKTLGLQWFAAFIFPMIFIHHFILFFTESGNFYYFFTKLFKIFASSLLTFIILVIYQYLFYRRERN